MQVDRRVIESGLRAKGFVENRSRDHRYFHHQYQGKSTGVWTYTSHGSKYKSCGVELLNRMTKELKLERTKDAVDLFKCPLSMDGYNEILKRKGCFKP